jgi:large repetitive protein
MISTQDLSGELSDLGQAIGLIDGSGNLNTHWFENPLGELESVFTDQTQRGGLMDFLDALLPPATLGGLPQGEKWHPLLGNDPSLRGNLYLLVKDNGANVLFGVAGDFSTPPGTTPSASLRARLPLISANSGIHAIAGTSDGPLSVELRLTLGWTRATQPIALNSVVMTATLAPLASGGPQESLVVELEGLDLDGSGAKDTLLDPNQLGAEATHLILGLIQYELGQLGAGLPGEQQAIINHLLPLLGLGGGIPPFPFLEVASNPLAIRTWFASLLTGGPPPIQAWLTNLAGLFGSTFPVTGTGTSADPWTANIFALNASSNFGVTLAQSNGALQFGVGVQVAPGGANPVARIEAQAVLASLPLAGTGSAAVLPSASVVVRTPGAEGMALVSNAPAIAVGHLRAGFVWNGTAIAPLLELDTVTLAGTAYPHIDLTNADSVVQAAEAAVLANLTAALGGGVGLHLAALAGFVKPTGDPVATPHLIEPSVLVTNPARAIGAVHRAVLVDPADSWSYLFGDLLGLLQLPGPVLGTGTQSDPWRVTLGSAGALNLEFAAWNAATAHGPADVQKLRIGLRASATSAPFQFWWLAELLAVDLPLNAEGSISVMASQHAQFMIQPLPALPPDPNFTLAADSVRARMDWSPGGNMTWQAGIQNVQIVIDAAPAIAIPAINFPVPAIDVTNPAGTAAALGIPVAQVELVLRVVLARAVLSWGGMPAYVTAALLGVHGDLPGLPANWPTLADPGAAGSLLGDPFTALRNWLAQLATGPSPGFLPGLNWLQALLSNTLPATPQGAAPSFDASMAGSGTYDDPWALPLAAADAESAEALVWLEPAGPPASWAQPLVAAATAVGDFRVPVGVAVQLAAFVPALRSALSESDTAQLAVSLNVLANHLSTSDGVVPQASQLPTGGTWQVGTPITAAHDQQPLDASAITQILTQSDAWAGAGARAVLLLGPAFSTHDVWTTLLASPQRHGTVSVGANFDFRTGMPDPASVNLNSVTDAVDYYSADLLEDGTSNPASLVGQIASVVARIVQLRPGVPVTLVAHSTMGVPARLFTAANPALVRGLITLGTPHTGAPLPFFADKNIANAVRFIQQIFPSLPAGPLASALSHIVRALDGYAAPASADAVAAKSPYPIAAFNFTGAGTTDTGGVSALALGGSLAGDLLAAVKQAVSAMATAAAGSATTAPTHVSFGLRAALSLGNTPASAVEASARVRVDAFRVALHKPETLITRPERAASVRIRLSRPGDWLVGGPSSYDHVAGFVDVRVRWAELGVDIGSAVTPYVALHQTSFHGPMNAGVVAFTDAVAQPLVGAVFQGITSAAIAAGSSLAGLISALQALGVVVPDAHTPSAFGLSADAWSAISVDAGGYLAPRLGAALSTGVAGFTGTGPWVFAAAGLPVDLYVSSAPAQVGLRTSALALSSNASLVFDLSTTSSGATLQIGAFKLTWENGTLTAGAAPWLDSIGLIPPPNAATLEAALNRALPRLLLSGVFTAVLEGILGPGYQIPPIDSFFSSPGTTMQGSSAMGTGSGLSAPKINQLLQIISHVLRAPAGPGLNLPANLRLIAQGAGTDTDPTALHLLTTAPLGGILGIDLSAAIDSAFHVTPGGQVTINVPLPGTWGGIGIAFGASPTAVSLTITPQLAGVGPIQILPAFSGLGDSLRGALEALLPRVLDEVVSDLGPPVAGTVLQGALDVATALGIYGPGGFAANAQALRNLTQGNFLASFAGPSRPAVATAIANLFGIPALGGALPGAVTASAGTVTWSEPLAGSITGTATISLGWDGSGPKASLELSSVKLASGGITASVSAGYASGTLQCSVELGISLASTLGLQVEPRLRASVGGGKFSVILLPLSSTAGDGPVSVSLAPSPGVTLAAGGAEQLVAQILLPLASSLVLDAVKPSLTHSLWTGGPTVETILVDAHLIVKGATPDKDTLAPLPSLTAIISGLLQAVAGSVHIPVSSTLKVSLINDGGSGGNRLGIALSGVQEFPAGAYTLKVHFGAPADWAAGMDEGLGLYLFQSGGASFQFMPGLHCVGIGIGITGQNDGPLINTDQFRLGGLDGYVFFDVDFQGGVTFAHFGAGLELDAFGIPLGQATGGGVGGNPVAAGLLQSGGAPGDNHPVNPGVDVAVWAVPKTIVPGPANDGKFHIRFGDKEDQTLWIPVHAGFGPIYIDQLGIGITSDPGVDLLIDGSVKVDGLTAQANALGVTIPFKSIANPAGWSLDLGGLAIGFSSPGVTIAGGLLKNPGPPIEYDGMLLIQITQFGFVAVGAYSQPTDAQGKYTSLFVFAGIFVVVGLPPIIEIDGFGLGVGYNRELIVPDDLNQIPNFILVAALDDAGKLANDPMTELMSIRDSIPARRGSFWLAVGLHGTSFVIVHVTAVVYVALDRGVEVGVLGVARMALPSDDTALVSIELALKARFSTAEGILSIQAQLTDNSWLLSKDCQLTGGFAYFMWFPQSQFVLSIGGYNPNFHKPTEFPDVPRLGYHWSLLGAINIKGESYFALTNTCVMAGARMEATYGPDCIHVWFTAYTDFLLSWDPFFYDIQIGISVGAAFHMEICFIGCVDIDITVSLGASLHVSGPPLHGEVTVDLAIASVTVAFGPSPNPDSQFITDFGAFSLKYLYGNDPKGFAVATHVLTGLLPPEPAGGQPAPGTADLPWRMGAEFSFQTETRMPATASVDFVTGPSGELANVSDIDFAPMGLAHPHVATVHQVSLEKQQNDKSWAATAVAPDHFTVTRVINQFSEATWHCLDHANMPAAARTVPALGGLQITGFAVTVNQSALIPISKLVDASNSRPLPFATLAVGYLDLLLSYGVAADLLSQLSASAGSNQTISVAGQLLSGGGFFGDARLAAGMPAQGLTPVQLGALRTRRSAPPVIAPITTGLTMRAVGLAPPPAIRAIPPATSIPLLQPRLRAVLQARPQPIADAPAALRTTVAELATDGIPRMAPPRLDTVAGALLQRVAAPNAVRPTAIARAAKTLRNPEVGWAAGAAHSAAVRQAAADFIAGGVTLAAGANHVWDLPPVQATLAVTGSAGVRLTFLSRSGGVLDDRELVPGANGASLPIPPKTERLVAQCLGNPPSALAFPQGFGAISASAAPRSDFVVTGWQSASMLVQAGTSVFLARGASLRLPRPFTPVRSGIKTSQSMIRASEVMRNETAVETSLPIETGAVMILLDQTDATASAAGDLGIAAEGATLSTPPLRVEGGNRLALLYQVAQIDQGAASVSVSIASVAGWRVSGVVGLPGQAQDWAVRMNGGVPIHLVPEGPLTPDGQVTIRFVSTTGDLA